MGGACLAFLLCVPAHAQRYVVDVERAEVVATDGGVSHHVGGCFLDVPTCVSVAQDVAQLRAENASLRAQAGAIDTRPLVVVAVLGLVLGVATGWALARR